MKMKKLFFSLAVSFCLSIGIHAQDAQPQVGQIYEGTVLDETGLALPGASITLIGTGDNYESDESGKFQFTAKPGDSILVNFMGYEPAKRYLTEGTDPVGINLIKSKSTNELQEVVLTMGVSKKKKAVGFAVQELNFGKENTMQNSDPVMALQGKLAGVNIASSSGSPTASTRVVMRGLSSLGGSNQPLYVVDGVPISNNTIAGTGTSSSYDLGNLASNIDPNTIQTITVLKGSSATVKYGSRAANGVILITTKGARKGDKLKVSISFANTLYDVGRLPYFQNKFGQGWSSHYASNENGSWGPLLDDEYHTTGWVVDNTQKLKKFSDNSGSIRDVFDRGYTTENFVSISKGTDMAGIYASLSNLKSDGILPGDVDTKDRTNLLFKANGGTKNTTINFDFNFVSDESKTNFTGQGSDATFGGIFFQDILQIPIDHYIPDLRDYNDKFNNSDNYFSPYVVNPYFILNNTGVRADNNRFYGNVGLKQVVDLGEDEELNFSAKYGYDVSAITVKRFGNKTSVDPNGNNASQSDTKGAVGNANITIVQNNVDLVSTYSNKISDDFSFDALLGGNINARYYNYTSSLVTDLIVDGFYNLSNSSSTPRTSEYTSQKRIIGFYGELNFDYADYLFWNVTARNDFSSTLPIENNSIFYPGTSLSFVLSDFLEKENVMSKDIMSYSKIRVGLSQTGNDASPYQITSGYNTTTTRATSYGVNTFPLNGVPALEKSNLLPNGDLKPEVTTEFETGLELSFLTGRINLDFTYYDKVTDGLILSANVAPSTGYSSKTFNLGTISNKGYEVLLGLVPVDVGGFRWNMDFTYTENRNVLESLNEELGVKEYVVSSVYNTELVAIPGKDMLQLRVPDFKRDPQGRIIVGANGIPIEGEKKLAATTNPDFMTTLNNAFSYKGVSLRALIDYQQGGKMYSYTSSITFWSGNNEQSVVNDRKPYVVPNSVVEYKSIDDGKTYYLENTNPVYNNWHEYYSSNTNKPMEENRLIDKTFIKLREVSLSYSMDRDFLTSVGISSASITVYGRNLVMWTPATNSFVDPEITTYGNDIGSYLGEFAGSPQVRTYGLRINVNI